MYFSLGPLFPLVLALSVLLVAHIVWLVQLTRKLIQDGRTGRALALVPLAVITPLVSFYVAVIISRLHNRQTINVEGAPWRWLIPAVGVGSVIAAAVRTNLRYAPDYRSLSGAIVELGPWTLIYLLIASIAFMAVHVCGWTNQNPFLSRTHLLASAFVLWLAFAG